jgi:hypothetical protein
LEIYVSPTGHRLLVCYDLELPTTKNLSPPSRTIVVMFGDRMQIILPIPSLPFSFVERHNGGGGHTVKIQVTNTFIRQTTRDASIRNRKVLVVVVVVVGITVGVVVVVGGAVRRG